MSKQEALNKLIQAFNADTKSSTFRIGLGWAVDAIIETAKAEAKAEFTERLEAVQQRIGVLEHNTIAALQQQGRVLQKVVDTLEDMTRPKAEAAPRDSYGCAHVNGPFLCPACEHAALGWMPSKFFGPEDLEELARNIAEVKGPLKVVSAKVEDIHKRHPELGQQRHPELGQQRHPDIMSEDDLKDYYLGPFWRSDERKRKEAEALQKVAEEGEKGCLYCGNDSEYQERCLHCNKEETQ